MKCTQIYINSYNGLADHILSLLIVLFLSELSWARIRGLVQWLWTTSYHPYSNCFFSEGMWLQHLVLIHLWTVPCMLFLTDLVNWPSIRFYTLLGTSCKLYRLAMTTCRHHSWSIPSRWKTSLWRNYRHKLETWRGSLTFCKVRRQQQQSEC